MNLKGILFDFNGTLLFDSDMHIEAFRRLFPKYGLPCPSTEHMIKSFLGKPNRKIYEETVSPVYTEEELAKFIADKEAEYFNICIELGENFRLADGAVEMLDAIKAMGIPYCLATGSERVNVEFYVKHLKLDRWFEIGKNLIYEDGSFTGKPSPDIYNMAAKKIGLTPAECLIFEDATTGILAANAAKAGAVVVVYDKNYPSPLINGAKADAVYHDHRLWKEILTSYGLMR